MPARKKKKKKTSADFCCFHLVVLFVFFFLFCYQLHKHLIPQKKPFTFTSWSFTSPSRTPSEKKKEGEKKRKNPQEAGLGTTWPGHIYNLLSPFSVITRGTRVSFSLLLSFFFFFFLSPFSVQYVKTRSEKFASSQSPAIISLSSGVQ